MKKKLLLTLSICSFVAFGATLTGCDKKSSSSVSSTIDNQTILQAAINGLSVPEEVDTSFTLTTTGVGGVKFAWSSSNTSIITIDMDYAQVTRPTDADKTVTLTATASLGTDFLIKDFDVLVKKIEYDLPEETITVREAKESEIGTSVTVAGVVSAIVGGEYNSAYSANGFYLTDETQTIYVYGYIVANQVERGDYVCITATVAEYSSVVQLTSPSLYNEAVLSKNNEIPDPTSYAITGKTIDEVYNPTNNPGMGGSTYIFTCYIITYSGGSYTNYEIITSLENGTYMNIYSSAGNLSCPENAWLDQYVEAQQEVRLAYYINSTNSAGTSYRGNVIKVFDAE